MGPKLRIGAGLETDYSPRCGSDWDYQGTADEEKRGEDRVQLA